MLDEGIITTTILKKSTEELMSYAQSSDVIVSGAARRAHGRLLPS